MKKIYLLFTLLAALGLSTQAQTVLTTQQIQQPTMAGSCNDTSPYFGDTVIVRGVVVMDGGLAQVSGGRNIWIQQNGGGPWSGLDVFGFSGSITSPDDILSLVQGDSVEILGYIDEYQGESEIRPLQTGTSVTVLGAGLSVNPTVVNIGDLNDGSRNNQIATGEQWEGAFIEIQNVTVTNVSTFGSNRFSIDVQDASGNVINVSDRFLAGRLAANGGPWTNTPSVGDFFTSIKGVLSHSKNDCPGFNGRGYELYPFDFAHYQVGSAAPSIGGISRNNVCVTPSNTVTICANITDGDGIASATLQYAVGQGASTYTPVTMTNTSGNTWCADIPAQADGSFVKYYIESDDNAANTSIIPNVPGGSDPEWYWVRTNGCTIYDLQYIPSSYGSDLSPYLDLDVTFEGVVTASAEPGNLGYVFVQQENQLAWAGIMLVGDPSLASLTVGQKVSVSGTVEENFGFTRVNVSNISVNGTGTITGTTQDPNLFSTYDLATNEAYESMLITLTNTTVGNPVYVVDDNPDSPSNFAEWKVGSDQFDPSQGCRIITGRQTSSAFSSLNASYVNDSLWQVTDGAMNVGPCVVQLSDAFDNITGIMQYSFGAWKMSPRNNMDFTNGPNCTALAVEDVLENNQVTVYPNPAQTTLNVAYELEGANATAIMYDLMGRSVATASLNGVSGKTTLDVASLPAGTYLLNIIDANGVRIATDRIVIAK